MQDSIVRNSLTMYAGYWRDAVVEETRREAAEHNLLQSLRVLFNKPSLDTVANAEPLIAERLRAAGYYSLQGKTGPLRELMVWHDQTEKDCDVELPEGRQSTRVFFMDGFLSRGWSSYFTCGRTGTGGWSKPEGLYAVVPAYSSLSDENFIVNFLSHESQHFADQTRFPGLQNWEKEYRAKLVEVALANSTRIQLLIRLTSSQGDNKNDPHSYANRRVLTALRERLGAAGEHDGVLVIRWQTRLQSSCGVVSTLRSCQDLSVLARLQGLEARIIQNQFCG